MKKIKLNHIVEQSGSEYELWAELVPCATPKDYTMLLVYSLYSGAKDPNLQWERAKILLSPEALNNLKELLINHG